MKQSSIKVNFGYQMLYEIVIILIPFITSPYLARVIGAVGLGTYSFSYSVAFYFVLFSMLGIKNYGNRSVAQVKDDINKRSAVFSSLFIVHMIISSVCIIAYILYIMIINNDKIYAILQIPYVVSAFFDISWFYFGMENFKATVIRSTCIKIFTFVLIFILVKNGNDLWKYCLIMSVGALISQLILWLPLKKYVRFIKPSRDDMLVHIKPLLTLFIPAVAISLYKYMDKIMIGTLSSKIQLGYYENAEKIINIPSTIVTAFGAVMLPKISNLIAKKESDQASNYMRNSVIFIMFIAFAMMAGVAGVSNIFAVIFWGKEFIISGKIMIILAFTIPFVSFADIIRTQYLIPHNLDREYLTSVVLGALINILINSILIKRYGAQGAAFGTVIAEITVCVTQIIFVKNKINMPEYLRLSVRFVVPCLITFLCVWSFGKGSNFSIKVLLFQILIGCSVYIAASIPVFYFTDSKLASNILKPIKRILVR